MRQVIVRRNTNDLSVFSGNYTAAVAARWRHQKSPGFKKTLLKSFSLITRKKSKILNFDSDDAVGKFSSALLPQIHRTVRTFGPKLSEMDADLELRTSGT